MASNGKPILSLPGWEEHSVTILNKPMEFTSPGVPLRRLKVFSGSANPVLSFLNETIDFYL